jgi:hypothetical protein
MSEVAERASNVLGRALGNTVAPGVTALMLAASVSTGNVDLAMWATPAGAVAGSLTEEGVSLVRRSWTDRSRRVEQFAEAAAKEAQVSIDELVTIAAESAEARRLLGITVESATQAQDDWKIRMLAKVFVRGAADPAKVDELAHLTALLRDVDGADARLMAAMVNLEAMNGMLVQGEEIAAHDPGIGRLAVVLHRKLAALELVVGKSGPMYGWGLTSVGDFCVQALAELEAMPRPPE